MSDIQKILVDSRQGLEDKTHEAQAEDLKVARQTMFKGGMEEITNWSKEDMAQVQKLYESTWADWLAQANPEGKAYFEKTRSLTK